MKIMIDTNIIIDIYAKRTRYYEKSYLAYIAIFDNGHTPIISASAVTDAYYIMRRITNRDVALESISKILKSMVIADTTGININDALESKGPDFEDNVLASVAKRNAVDYIITRNVNDFRHSKVKALTPEEFLKKEKKDHLRVHEDTLELYSV